jgi:hypothetical protein
MERFGLWFHLLYCKFCKLFIRQVEQLESATRKFYQNTERFHLSAERKAGMKRALDVHLNK